MHPVLRLSEDFLTDRGAISFPALPRMFFIVRGAAMFGTRSLATGEAWYSDDAVTVRAGPLRPIVRASEAMNGDHGENQRNDSVAHPTLLKFALLITVAAEQHTGPSVGFTNTEGVASHSLGLRRSRYPRSREATDSTPLGLIDVCVVAIFPG